MYDTMNERGIQADHCTFIALFMVSTRLAPCHSLTSLIHGMFTCQGGLASPLVPMFALLFDVATLLLDFPAAGAL